MCYTDVYNNLTYRNFLSTTFSEDRRERNNANKLGLKSCLSEDERPMLSEHVYQSWFKDRKLSWCITERLLREI